MGDQKGGCAHNVPAAFIYVFYKWNDSLIKTI